MLSDAAGICRGVHEATVGPESTEQSSSQARMARQRALRANEEAALEAWARSQGVWVAQEAFESAYKAGGGAEEGEAMVYFDPARNAVVKANDGNMHRC